MPATLVMPRPYLVNGYGHQYYRDLKSNGLDLLAYGDWQRRYGRWIVDTLQLHRQRVLDVGCACGSMLRGMWQAGAQMHGIDCSEFLIQMGRWIWPELRDRLFVCDAVNLHCIPNAGYDWLHSCVVAEHWRPALVPYILEELRRVVKPGGSFYCAYESESVTMADGRDPADEPTHLCLKSPAWWEDHLRRSGWQVTSSEWAAALETHPESLLSDYRWSWFVARHPP
ncbi:MAG: class I SAM-dependent methyltransferase [Planctomycetia bacterium]|nr:class I SAM-dependent methyltransferase [Planctomycetia bacterium]